jgi:light-regulated signal transduction histidine kinase (bacteriophytochrome)
MPDNFTGTKNLVETLSLYRVLEGLIHNINTPLNVVIGYSQQLKKQYPDITYLDKITEAGLAIDDLIRSCAESFVGRLDNGLSSFDLNKWLEVEIRFLKNILEVKHAVKFEIKPGKNLPEVLSNQLMLSLFFESLVLFIRNKCELKPGNRTLSVSAEMMHDKPVLLIRIPVCTRMHPLSDFMKELSTELADSFELVSPNEIPFSCKLADDNAIMIQFNT